ncbi:MAG: cache domain-containing protein, partial [Gammaproteobacteria bacterium]
MSFSIRWKLILSIVGPVILIAFFGMKVTIDVIQSTINIRLHEQATESARNYATKLDAEFRPIAQVARNTAAFLEAVPDLDEAELFTLLRANVEQNPLIYGSAIAYEPYQFDSDIELFSPYVYRQGDEFKKIDVAIDAYDYTAEQWEWYNRTRDTGKALWTE